MPAHPLLPSPTSSVAPPFPSPSAGAQQATAAENGRFLALVWIAGALALRALSASETPLGNGEAYYYAWSRFLSLSYYDHPPLIAWLVWVTTDLFGGSTFAVRLGPVIASGVFGYLVYKIGERLYGPRGGFFSLVLVSGLPVFLASSMLVNPEAPLAPLWAGYLLVVDRMRSEDDASLPLLAGGLLGAAFLAKYTALLLVPGTFAYVAFSARGRRWLRRPSFYAGGAIALLVASPVIAWNAARGWPSLALHFVERAGATPVAGENAVNQLVEAGSSAGSALGASVLRVATGQLMAYSPLLVPVLLLSIAALTWRARRDDRDLFLAAFAWPALVLLLASMVRLRDSEQHWTMMAFVPVVLAAGRFARGDGGLRRWARGLTYAGAAVSGVVAVGVYIHTHSTVFLDAFAGEGYDPRADLANELNGWDAVRAAVRAEAAKRPGAVVASSHYSLCGRLLFELDDRPVVYCPTGRRTAFDFFGRRVPPAVPVLAVTSDIHTKVAEGLADRTCQAVRTVDVRRSGRHVAGYTIHECVTAASPPPPDPPQAALLPGAP